MAFFEFFPPHVNLELGKQIKWNQINKQGKKQKDLGTASFRLLSHDLRRFAPLGNRTAKPPTGSGLTVIKRCAPASTCIDCIDCIGLVRAHDPWMCQSFGFDFESGRSRIVARQLHPSPPEVDLLVLDVLARSSRRLCTAAFALQNGANYSLVSPLDSC